MNFYTNFIPVGKNIYVSGYNNNKKYIDKVEYLPKLYTPCQQKTPWRDFYGKRYLMEKEFDTPYEFRDFIKNYQDIDGFCWGIKDYQYQYIFEKYGQDIQYDNKLIHGAIIDIEVMTRERIGNEYVDGGFPNASEAKYPINAICHYDTKDKKYYLFLLKHDGIGWDKSKSCFPDIAADVIEQQFDDEKTMLRAYIAFWNSCKLDFVSGWNVDIFDIPYIINRYKNLFGDNFSKMFSPIGIIKEKRIKTAFGVEMGYSICGISILDYLALYKKFTYKVRESYTLDFIGKIECGVEKKKFVGTHGSFYWDDIQGFADYNINDVYIVVALDKKVQLLNLSFSIAYFAGINYEDVFSPIRTWENLIFRICFADNVVAPIPKSKAPHREEYEGAFVVEPVVGTKRMIVSVDYTSLYPSVMRTINISADSLDSDWKSRIADIAEMAKSKGDTKFYDALTNHNLRDYNVENELPDYAHEYLVNNNLAIATNCTLYDTKKESKVVGLLSSMFKQRKSDKKTSFNYKHKALDIEEELKKRGVKI